MRIHCGNPLVQRKVSLNTLFSGVCPFFYSLDGLDSQARRNEGAREEPCKKPCSQSLTLQAVISESKKHDQIILSFDFCRDVFEIP